MKTVAGRNQLPASATCSLNAHHGHVQPLTCIRRGDAVREGSEDVPDTARRLSRLYLILARPPTRSTDSWTRRPPADRTAHRESEARARGITALYLLTTTAAGFFERLGYKPHNRTTVSPSIAATAEFSSLCLDTAACLWRNLST